MNQQAIESTQQQTKERWNGVTPPSDAEIEDLANALVQGKRRALARAITLVESKRLDHRLQAEGLLRLVGAAGNESIRIGISGMPGVGKSSFIEAFGGRVIDQGHRLAVLSIDPSSSLSGGSILGDKTRMASLTQRPEAFIRPSPAGQTLGGVARRTRETILLCEAAGFDVVMVETVGVGQSETAVADMTDMFVLMLLPGGGDELQGIKRGIMELADLILINKADGDLAAEANRTAAEYSHATRLMLSRSRHWKVPVQTCSAHLDQGISEAWETIQSFRDDRKARGEFEARRAKQACSWLWTELNDGLLDFLTQHPLVKKRLPELEADVAGGQIPAPLAARELLNYVLQVK